MDYNSTFAPTARSSTIRILLSVAGTYDLELRNYDIVSAFLGSKLKEDIWVTLPAGVRGFQKGQVVKLLASVYGLKQAARCWWKTLDEHLRGIGFRATVVDPCLYYRWIEDKYWLMALVVDDMILATNDTSGLVREGTWQALRGERHGRPCVVSRNADHKMPQGEVCVLFARSILQEDPP